jgi:riboflavin kinase/FMN adenylyltransferase
MVRSLAAWRAPARRGTVVTIGNFDGVHRGHQRILRAVCSCARALGAASVAVTFDPHPLKLLRPAAAPPLLSTLRQRLAALRDAGLDAVLLLRFDRALSRLSPRAFVERVLVGRLRARAVVVGENFRFGHRHAGDIALLRQLGREFGFEVDVVPPLVVRGEVVSSTAVRRAIAEGRVEAARRLLGRPFALTGKAVRGAGRGRRLVFPTLNLDWEQEVLPRPGVYAAEVVLRGPSPRAAGNRRYKAATNVGLRPTFGGRRMTVESHLLGFSGASLPGGTVEVRFAKRLRGEKRFRGPAALRAQVARDIARVRAFFRAKR